MNFNIRIEKQKKNTKKLKTKNKKNEYMNNLTIKKIQQPVKASHTETIEETETDTHTHTHY